MAITKPPVLPAWAESGDKVTPSNAEIQVGWPLSSIPPSRQRFNWLLNFLANGVRYFSRRGLPDYDAAETYMTGDRIIGDDGKTYRSLIDNNTAQTPSTSPTKWEPWALTQSQGDVRVQNNSAIASAAGGTADAITGAYLPAITALTNGMSLYVRAGVANATTTPTFKADGTAVKTICKGNGLALAAGDIAGGGHWIELQYDATLNKWVLLNPANGVFAAAQQPGEVCLFARNTAPNGFLKCNGAAISRSSYAALFAALVKTSTATISIASPGVVTWNSHGLSANDPVKFTTTGALPTGLVAGTTYYVVGTSITTNTFQLSATAGGTAINTSGAMSGTHTAINAPFGDGDGSTTFNVPDLRGEFLRGWDDSRAIDANRSFGSWQVGTVESHSHSVQTFGGSSGTYASGSLGLYSNTGAYGGSETKPRNIAMLACIKY